MGFNDLIDRCNGTVAARFANCTVLAEAPGLPDASFRGIFDQSVEVVSPFESDRIMFKPQLSVQSGNLADITSDYTFTITTDDGAVRNKKFGLDGKPRPDGAGMTLMYLTGKR